MKLVPVALVILLAGCASVPEPPTKSLQIAVGSSDVEQVRANLSSCAAEGTCDLDRRNDRGETVLHGASVLGRADIAELLIRAGADVNASAYDGATPLHRAATNGNTDIAALLLRAGADAKARSTGGLTPLQSAALAAQAGAASLLREYEAGRVIRDWQRIFAVVISLGVSLAVFAGLANSHVRNQLRELRDSENAYHAYRLWRLDREERGRGEVMVRGGGKGADSASAAAADRGTDA